jgi:hypothetical protein
VRAKLHDDAVARRLGANAAELKYNLDLLDSIAVLFAFLNWVAIVVSCPGVSCPILT